MHDVAILLFVRRARERVHFADDFELEVFVNVGEEGFAVVLGAVFEFEDCADFGRRGVGGGVLGLGLVGGGGHFGKGKGREGLRVFWGVFEKERGVCG